MTRLEDLLYSLATVIVMYHDSQKVPQKIIVSNEIDSINEQSRKHATNLINTNPQYYKEFENYISICTSRYPDRKPLLSYLLHELEFLKIQLDKKNSYSPEQMSQYINEVHTLLKDLKSLLNTRKGDKYTVTYSNPNLDGKTGAKITLSGLNESYYYKIHLCNSGNLIKEEILDRLNLSHLGINQGIEDMAKTLCTGHQNSLKVREMEKELLTKQQEIDEKDKTINQLKETIQKLESEKDYNEHSIQGLRRKMELITKKPSHSYPDYSDQSFFNTLSNKTKDPSLIQVHFTKDLLE